MSGERRPEWTRPADQLDGLDPATVAVRALGAALLGAGIWIGAGGPLGLTWGLVAVAAFVGWLVGSAVRRRTTALGATVVAGGIGLLGTYLYALAAAPGTTSLSERVGSVSIVDFYAQQYGLLVVVQLAALLLAAWWSSR